ncbi:unnamed protein product [Prunus brigantina]
MEASQSNTLNASISTPSIKLETQAQPQTQPQDQQINSVNVGEKRKPSKSVVWLHCKKMIKKDAHGVKVIGVCNYCKEEMPADSKKNGTTGLKNHLARRCKLSPLYQRGDETQSVLNSETMGGGLFPQTFNQKRSELKCVMFLIKDEMPFRAVEGSGFRDFITELQPSFKIPNKKEIAAGVWDLFLVEKAKIMSLIGDQRVSITTDTWTSIQNINYMVVTAHFMDNDWKLHKRIINFTKITSHKGDDIGRCLEACLNSWGIDKVFSITVDNASANDEAVEYMAKSLKSKNTIMLDGKYLHMRCACHILNLIVKDVLKELYNSIEGIRNCVKYIHSSSERLAKFRDFVFLEKNEKMANVPMDDVTRWNATYKMLDGALKYKKMFSRMADDNASFVAYFNEYEKDAKEGLVKRVGPPVEEDWENAQALVHFLKKFYDTTLKLSATKTCTSNLVFTEMVGLQVEIEKKMKDGRDPKLQRVAFSIKLKLEKFWGSFETVNKLVFVAHVLDPRYKLQMLKIIFRNLGAEPTKIDFVVSEVKKCMLTLYNEYKGSASIGNLQLFDLQDEDAKDELDGDDAQSQLVRDLLQQIKEEQLADISNEVDKYFADPFENALNKGFKLLDWWKGNQSRYPILSKIAKEIFSIPSSTVTSENAFSLGKRIVDPFRSSLTPEMVEALVCTCDWLRADEFCFYKEPTDEELEFYKQLEEIQAISSTAQTSTNQPPPLHSSSTS